MCIISINNNWNDSCYYAKVTVTFTNSSIVAANKVTLDSIASDYGWVGADKIFSVYEKANENNNGVCILYCNNRLHKL